MASKYSKEGIITRCEDYLCLVCEDYFTGKEDADKHVSKPIHKKNLAATSYFEEFEDDRIRKVPSGFYCEFCNLFISISAKIQIHIDERDHINNKIQPKDVPCLVKRVNSRIVYDEMVITEDSWHSLKGDMCGVCSVHFHNMDIHKSEFTHILNMVQKNILFSDQKHILYRLMNDGSFQCLHCNEISALKYIDKHENEPNHREELRNSRELYNDMIKKNDLMFDEDVNESDAGVPTFDLYNGQSNIQTNDLALVLGDKQLNKIVTQNKSIDSKQDNSSSDEFFEADDNIYSSIELDQLDCLKKLDIDTFSVSKHDESFVEISKNTVTHHAKKQESNLINRNDISDEVSKNQAEENRSKILESVRKFEANEVNINFETEMGFCKKCFQNIEFDFDIIMRHIENDIRNKKKRELEDYVPYARRVVIPRNVKNEDAVNQGSTAFVVESRCAIECNRSNKVNEDDEEFRHTYGHEDDSPQEKSFTETTTSSGQANDPMVYAKENKITYNCNNENAYCRTCDCRIPSFLESMKEHVNGKKHNRALQKKVENQPIYRKRRMEKFCDNIVYCRVNNIFFEEFIHVFINVNIRLSPESYFVMSECGPRLRCQLCNISMFRHEMVQHGISWLHETRMDVPVITSLNEEFIREIRPDLYHCGFCNFIVSGTEELAKHLECSEHDVAKARAKALAAINESKVRQCLRFPTIRRHFFD